MTHLLLLAAALVVSAPPGPGGDRLRGAMVSPTVNAEDLEALGREWRANHVRWQLTWGSFPRGPADEASPEAYRAWLAEALARLERLLPVCAQAGLRVVVDLHSTPGGRDRTFDSRIFKEERWQREFVASWEAIAERFKGNRTIWGYDLANEPSEGKLAPGLDGWRALALRTARRIREIDPERTLIIEPAPWAEPSALASFEPLPLANVVYSVHMYQPQAFTHQGVFDRPMGLRYPGTIEGRRWDARGLRRALEPVRAFQVRHGARIYIGEFSAIRWAPAGGAARYLEDVIRIFEEHGWDWAYHAFREWHGWSPEHGDRREDEERAARPTERARILKDWFRRNRTDPAPPR